MERGKKKQKIDTGGKSSNGRGLGINFSYVGCPSILVPTIPIMVYIRESIITISMPPLTGTPNI
jgi:hypothetical protein